MQTVREVSEGQLDSSLAWLVMTRGWGNLWAGLTSSSSTLRNARDRLLIFLVIKMGGIMVNLISGLFPTGAAIVVFLPSSSETLVH